MKALDRVKSWFGWGGAEGSWRGPFYGQGEQGNWFELGGWEDGFQRNLSLRESQHVAAVYAAVMLNARAISQCQPQHLRAGEAGGWNQVLTSPAARVLHSPNEYESFNQIILNTVAEMLFEGEALWLAFRDDRNAITEVHRIPRGGWSISVEPNTKEIFYAISQTSGDLTKEPDYLVPARDVAHFRMYCPRHALIGESPIKAAAMAIGINVALTQSQMAFFSQMSRPSGIISTDAELTIEQMKQLRDAWAEQSKSINQGKVPILGGNLRFQPMNVAAGDAQLIEQQKMSIADIARVYGVPMTLLSDSAAPQAGTEAMIQHWLSVGLGSVIESVERTIERLFRIPVSETVQLDPTPLLRTDTEARISAWAKAVQGGIMTVDEARAKERLGPVEGGNRAFLQRQMTPVDLLTELAANELRQPEPAPAPAAEPPVDEPNEDDAKAIALHHIRKAMTA